MPTKAQQAKADFEALVAQNNAFFDSKKTTQEIIKSVAPDKLNFFKSKLGFVICCGVVVLVIGGAYYFLTKKSK